jgi:hypothetical protein
MCGNFQSSIIVSPVTDIYRWTQLPRYCDDDLLEIDNFAADRALQAVALGRKHYLFAGSKWEGLPFYHSHPNFSDLTGRSN